tara:strand:+ start:258 stop:359 length:102 start_codon:yes stop_codon:yes gene_type:complete
VNCEKRTLRDKERRRGRHELEREKRGIEFGREG